MAQEFFRSDFSFTSCNFAAITYHLPLIPSLTRGRTLTILPNGRAPRDAAPLTKAVGLGGRRERVVAVASEITFVTWPWATPTGTTPVVVCPTFPPSHRDPLPTVTDGHRQVNHSVASSASKRQTAKGNGLGGGRPRGASLSKLVLKCVLSLKKKGFKN